MDPRVCKSKAMPVHTTIIDMDTVFICSVFLCLDFPSAIRFACASSLIRRALDHVQVSETHDACTHVADELARDVPLQSRGSVEDVMASQELRAQCRDYFVYRIPYSSDVPQWVYKHPCVCTVFKGHTPQARSWVARATLAYSNGEQESPDMRGVPCIALEQRGARTKSVVGVHRFTRAIRSPSCRIWKHVTTLRHLTSLSIGPPALGDEMATPFFNGLEQLSITAGVQGEVRIHDKYADTLQTLVYTCRATSTGPTPPFIPRRMTALRGLRLGRVTHIDRHMPEAPLAVALTVTRYDLRTPAVLDVTTIDNRMPNLHRLKVVGSYSIGTPPHAEPLSRVLRRLTHLSLWSVTLKRCDANWLAELPELKELDLRRITCSETTVHTQPKLKRLTIVACDDIKAVEPQPRITSIVLQDLNALVRAEPIYFATDRVCIVRCATTLTQERTIHCRELYLDQGSNVSMIHAYAPNLRRLKWCLRMREHMQMNVVAPRLRHLSVVALGVIPGITNYDKRGLACPPLQSLELHGDSVKGFAYLQSRARTVVVRNTCFNGTSLLAHPRAQRVYLISCLKMQRGIRVAARTKDHGPLTVAYSHGQRLKPQRGHLKRIRISPPLDGYPQERINGQLVYNVPLP